MWRENSYTIFYITITDRNIGSSVWRWSLGNDIDESFTIADSNSSDDQCLLFTSDGPESASCSTNHHFICSDPNMKSSGYIIYSYDIDPIIHLQDSHQHKLFYRYSCMGLDTQTMIFTTNIRIAYAQFSIPSNNIKCNVSCSYRTTAAMLIG